jgi:hypothetical protein
VYLYYSRFRRLITGLKIKVPQDRWAQVRLEGVRGVFWVHGTLMLQANLDPLFPTISPMLRRGLQSQPPQLLPR